MKWALLKLIVAGCVIAATSVSAALAIATP
jgi:hypothetical protein